jgi:hypothetical protein
VREWIQSRGDRVSYCGGKRCRWVVSVDSGLDEGWTASAWKMLVSPEAHDKYLEGGYRDVHPGEYVRKAKHPTAIACGALGKDHHRPIGGLEDLLQLLHGPCLNERGHSTGGPDHRPWRGTAEASQRNLRASSSGGRRGDGGGAGAGTTAGCTGHRSRVQSCF